MANCHMANADMTRHRLIFLKLTRISGAESMTSPTRHLRNGRGKENPMRYHLARSGGNL